MKLANAWPLDLKSQLTRKDPEAGKDWGQKDKEETDWDVWMASLTQWTWVWAKSGRWWRSGKPRMLQSKGSQRVRYNLVTKQQQQKIVLLSCLLFMYLFYPKKQTFLCSHTHDSIIAVLGLYQYSVIVWYYSLIYRFINYMCGWHVIILIVCASVCLSYMAQSLKQS